MVALHWIKDEGVQMLGVPSWAWAVIIGLAYFNYFFFKYAHKLRVQIQESRTEIAKLRAEGVVIRNDGLEPFLSDRSFNEWSPKVTDWNERTKEALSTNADTVASACPFCMTMITDGVKQFEKSDDVSVKDIAEIILEYSN